MFTVGSLFSGIGGLDIAFEMTGGIVQWQVEKDPFCRKVLAKHWPNAIQHSDIYECHDLPYVDCLIAGFPCQPFSIAGSRKGKDDERYLIPEMFRIIRECRPRTCLFENVRGLTSINDGAIFRDFLRELAACGYDAEWAGVRASDFGAPHERYRVFIVAYTERFGHSGQSAVANAAPDEKRNAATHQQSRNAKPNANLSSRSVLGHPKQLPTRSQDELESRRKANAFTRARVWLANPAKAKRASLLLSGARNRKQGRPIFQPGVGRAADGTADGMDGFDFPGFPAGQGTYQYDFEPARTIAEKGAYHKDRIKALGNAVVPQQALPFAQAIAAYLNLKEKLP